MSDERLIAEARRPMTDLDITQDPAATRAFIRRLADALEAAEKAHTPTDDEREALIEQATWALIEWDTDTADRGVRDEHYRDRRGDVERVFPILFRRSEVPEPSAAREFLKAALAESDADEAEGGAGWDVEVDARTVLELLDEPSEPQGEPSDAQVEAACAAWASGSPTPNNWENMTQRLQNITRDRMRAALRAAGGAR